MKVNDIRTFLQAFLSKRICSEADVARFRALMDAHPAWKGRSIQEYRVRTSRLNQPLQLQVRPNVRWVTVSWHACADNHAMRQAPCALTNAMRQAVVNHVQRWKRAQATKLCVACGATRNVQVDHHPMPFVAIKQAFLESTSLQAPEKFRFDRRTHGAAFYAGAFVRSWQEFHASRATYQFLCRSCNAKKGCRAALPSPSIVIQENGNCILTPNGPCLPTMSNLA